MDGATFAAIQAAYQARAAVSVSVGIGFASLSLVFLVIAANSLRSSVTADGVNEKQRANVRIKRLVRAYVIGAVGIYLFIIAAPKVVDPDAWFAFFDSGEYTCIKTLEVAEMKAECRG